MEMEITVNKISMSTRQELISSLCSSINDDKIDASSRDSISLILDKLINGSMSESDARNGYDEIINSISNAGYWKNKNLPKSLYDTLKSYSKSQLNDIQKMKMISSIITRSFIELEHNSELSLADLGVAKFIDILQNSINSDSYVLDDNELYSLLVEYGLINSKEV